MPVQFHVYFELVFVTVCQFLTGSVVETEINVKCQVYHITIRKIFLVQRERWHFIRYVLGGFGISVLCHQLWIRE
jgi:hypothetical protein